MTVSIAAPVKSATARALRTAPSAANQASGRAHRMGGISSDTAQFFMMRDAAQKTVCGPERSSRHTSGNVTN